MKIICRSATVFEPAGQLARGALRGVREEVVPLRHLALVPAPLAVGALDLGLYGQKMSDPDNYFFLENNFFFGKVHEIFLRIFFEKNSHEN